MGTFDIDLVKWLKRATGAGCLIYLLVFFVIAVQQIRYPYELEWMEGGMVDSVLRIVNGEPLYTTPSTSFTPYTYTPLYFHLSTWMTHLTGPGFLPLRLTAFIGTLGCLALLFLFGWKETRSPFYGLLSCGLFAALFRAGGAWYAVARADSWLLFFMLAGLLFLRYGRTQTAHAISAGLCFCLAFFCKQTALFVSLPLMAYTLLFFKGWRRILFPLIPALLIPASTILLSRLTDGWYSFYVFELPQGHHFVLFRALSFWLMDMFRPLFIALLFCAVYAGLLLRAKRWNDLFFLLFTLAGLIGAAFLVRIRAGSFANIVIPAYLGITLFFGVAVKMVSEVCRGETPDAPPPAKKQQIPAILLWLGCLAQLLSLFYDPTVQVPTADDRAAGDHLIQLIRRFPGDVFIPAHGYLAVQAGKAPHVQQVAGYDIERGNRTDLIESFTNTMNAVLLSGHFDAVILDFPWYHAAITNAYEYRGDVFDNDDVFWPVTGRRVRPKSLYVRKGLTIDVSDLIPGPKRSPQNNPEKAAGCLPDKNRQ